MAAGRFREDFYFRINVFTIPLPPLRERSEDIPALAEHFLQHFATQMNRRIAGFTPEAMAALVAYPWPGNVRELQNAIERAIVMCKGERIEAGTLPVRRAAGGGRRLALGDGGGAHPPGAGRRVPSTWRRRRAPSTSTASRSTTR